MLDTCLWTHPTKRVSLVFHVDDLLLATTRQTVTEILSELRRDLELKSSDVTTKPTLLGTDSSKNKGGVQLWFRCFVRARHAGGVQHVRVREQTCAELESP